MSGRLLCAWRTARAGSYHGWSVCMLIRILAHARTRNHALPKVQLCFKPALRSGTKRARAREKVGSPVIHAQASARCASRRDGLNCICIFLRIVGGLPRLIPAQRKLVSVSPCHGNFYGKSPLFHRSSPSRRAITKDYRSTNWFYFNYIGRSCERLVIKSFRRKKFRSKLGSTSSRLTFDFLLPRSGWWKQRNTSFHGNNRDLYAFAFTMSRFSARARVISVSRFRFHAARVNFEGGDNLRRSAGSTPAFF